MTRNVVLMLAICGVLFATNASACQCDDSKTPSINARAQKASHVLVVSIIGYSGEQTSKIKTSVDASVVDVLKGTLAVKHISIAGGVDEACGAEAKEFPIGSKWVLFLDLIGERSTAQRLDLGVLRRCAPIYYPIRNDKVYGYKGDDVNGLQLDELIKRSNTEQ